MRTLKILLVEDNPEDVFLMQNTLLEAKVPHELQVLEDGEEAIDYLLGLAAGDTTIALDLVVLDLSLPKRNGHEVLSEIRKCHAFLQLPVVVLTTSEDMEDRKKVLEHGASYVTKPANLENFFRVLEILEIATYDFAAKQSDLEIESPLEILGPERTKVLVVEDNPSDVLFLQELLKAAALPIELTVVETLKSALKYLSNHTPTIILADLGLPDADGLDVLLGLQSTAKDCPIVILTGCDEESVAEQALRQGAQDYLVKGQFDERTLLRSLRYAITRKQAEESALRAMSFENVVLQEILEHTPIGIARLDAKMNVVTCNQMFSDLLEVDNAATVGTDIVSLIPVLSPEVWAGVKNGTPFRLNQCPFKKRVTSENMVLDLTVWPIRSRDNDTKGGIVLALDITEQIKLLKQQDDFLASLAHDIKNPLLGAGQILKFLSNPSLSKEDQASMVSLLEQSNSSVLVMLQNLLEIYRYEANAKSLVFAPVQIGQPINDAVTLMAAAAFSKNIKVDVNLPVKLPLIQAECTGIERLFSNLLDNAIRFSKQDSVITISASEQSCDHTLTIEVSDTGSGMSAQQQAAIFQRFGESSAGKFKGGISSGLGLYLCKQIVESSNGSITCQSEQGVGTKFIIRFPVVLEPNLKEAQTC